MKKQYILLMLAFLMMGGIQAQDELSSLQKKRDIVGY